MHRRSKFAVHGKEQADLTMVTFTMVTFTSTYEQTLKIYFHFYIAIFFSYNSYLLLKSKLVIIISLKPQRVNNSGI